MRNFLYTLGSFLIFCAIGLIFANHLNIPDASTTLVWFIIAMMAGCLFGYLDFHDIKGEKKKVMISSLLCFVSVLVALVLSDLGEFIGGLAGIWTFVFIFSSVIFGVLFFRLKTKAGKALCGKSLVIAGLSLSAMLSLTRLPDAVCSPQERNIREAYSKYSRAKRYIHRREFHNAIKALDDAIRLDPGFADNYATRGSIYLLVGDEKKALTDYDKAFELETNNDSKGFFYRERGNVYLQLKEYDKAIADFTRAVELIVHFYKDGCYLGRAEAYFQKGEYDRAWADVRGTNFLHSTHIDFIEKLKSQYGYSR